MTRAYGDWLPPPDPLEDREGALDQVPATPGPRDRPQREPRADGYPGEVPRLGRVDRAETDLDCIVPRAGDEVRLRPLVVDPGHLVHEAACLRKHAGPVGLGQRTLRLVAEAKACLHTHSTDDELPASPGARERLDLGPEPLLRLVLRAGGNELQRLELGAGVADAPREVKSALSVPAATVEVVPRSEDGRAAEREQPCRRRVFALAELAQELVGELHDADEFGLCPQQTPERAGGVDDALPRDVEAGGAVGVEGLLEQRQRLVDAGGARRRLAEQMETPGPSEPFLVTQLEGASGQIAGARPGGEAEGDTSRRLEPVARAGPNLVAPEPSDVARQRGGAVEGGRVVPADHLGQRRPRLLGPLREPV